METIAIISLILSMLASGASMAMQQRANQQNIELAEGTREDQQQFSHEEAEIARQANIEQNTQLYNQIYSPQAKVQQYKDAGLSIGLMYSGGQATGNGGITTQMANTPSVAAPYVNPLMQPDMINNIMNAMKTAEESRKTNKESKQIEQSIENMQQQIKESNEKINNLIADTKEKEAETKLKDAQTDSEKLEKDLLELQKKFEIATFDNRIFIVEESLQKCVNQNNLLIEQVKELRIENSKKDEILETIIKKMRAEIGLILEKQILTSEQACTEMAKQLLMSGQYDLAQAEREQIESQIAKIEAETETIKQNYKIENFRLQDYYNGDYWHHQYNGLFQLVGDLRDMVTNISKKLHKH